MPSWHMWSTTRSWGGLLLLSTSDFNSREVSACRDWQQPDYTDTQLQLYCTPRLLFTPRNSGSTHSSNASAATLAPSFSNGGPRCQDGCVYHLLPLVSAWPSWGSYMDMWWLVLYSLWYESACIYALQIMSFSACDVFASSCDGGCCPCLLVFGFTFSCSYLHQRCCLFCLLDKPISFARSCVDVVR